MRRGEYFQLPEKFSFVNREYKSITGERSTLHDILSLPGRDVKERRVHDDAPRWRVEDKANLVKIFDDPQIDQETKQTIARELAISPEEIDSYRKRLQEFGLSGLAELKIRQERHAPKWKSVGPMQFNPDTGDIRCNGYFAILEQKEINFLKIFLRHPTGQVVPFEALPVPQGTARDLVSKIDRKLRALTGKHHFRNAPGEGYVFSAVGLLNKEL